MELRHLRYFLAVAESCHFRNAAEELLVSQPTLSQQIKDLEKELGTSLFERAGRGARLTQAGETFRDYARRAINVLEEGQVALQEFDDLLRGHLTIGVVQTVNVYLTPAVVVRFLKAYPKVNLHIVELSANDIEEGILSGRLDLGISFSPSSGRELQCEKLFEEELVLAVHPKHRLAGRKRIRIADLNQEPLCVLNRSFCTRRLIDASFQQAEAALHVAAEMNSIEGLIAVASSGGPPTIIPQLGAKFGADDSRVKVIRFEKPAPTRSICLLRPKRHAQVRARERFVSLLHEEIQHSIM